jgi:hypothetical protein
MVAAGFLGLNIFAGVFSAGATFLSGDAALWGLLLSGFILGLGSSPTHEVIKAIQNYKKSRGAEVDASAQVSGDGQAAFERYSRSAQVYGHVIRSSYLQANGKYAGYLRFVSEMGGGSYGATNAYRQLTGTMPYSNLSLWSSASIRVVYRSSSSSGGPVVEIYNLIAKTHEKIHFR